MKKVKKLLAATLTLTLCFSFSTGVFATELKGNVSDKLTPISFSADNKNIDSFEANDVNECIEGDVNESVALNAVEESKAKLKNEKPANKELDVTADSFAVNSLPDTDDEDEIVEDCDVDSYDEAASVENVSATTDDTNAAATDVTDDTAVASDTTATTDADSKVKTYEVNSNFNYSDTIAASDELHFYLINTANMDKLTAVIQFNEANVFSTIIYKYTSDGNLQEVTSSSNVLYDKMDTLSFIPDGGIYAVALSASNPGDFTFRLQESTSHSALEPNDNPFQANVAQDQFSIKDSFDNSFDEDWIQLNVTQDTEYRITKSENNCTVDNLYIIDFNSGNITPITDASTDISLLKGTYYIAASGTMTESDNSYSLTMVPKNSIVSKVNITSITSGTGSSTATYSQGSKYQVKDSMTVTGTAYNESNQVVKNGIVIVALQTHSGNLCYQAVTTDASGVFTANVTLKSASGSQSYYDSASSIKYYYDVAPIAVMNYNSETVTSNVTSVYHFYSSNYVTPAVSSINISKITAEKNGSEKRINYGYGNFWRVGSGNMTVTGTAYDANGNLVKYGDITMAVQINLNDTIYKGSTTTNSDGTFSITLNIGPAEGNYTFGASRSTHYFDIIPMVFVNSSGGTISCSDQLLYHYAYGMLY